MCNWLVLYWLCYLYCTRAILLHIMGDNRRSSADACKMIWICVCVCVCVIWQFANLCSAANWLSLQYCVWRIHWSCFQTQWNHVMCVHILFCRWHWVDTISTNMLCLYCLFISGKFHTQRFQSRIAPLESICLISTILDLYRSKRVSWWDIISN